MRRAWLLLLPIAAFAVATCTEFDGADKLLSGGAGGTTTSATSGSGGKNASGGGGAASSGKGGSSSSHGGASSAGGQGPGGGSPCPMAADPCDCDGDHHLALRCDGGDDCDDDDSRVFPGQTKFFSTPANGTDGGVEAYDFNCDGMATPEYPAVVTCSALSCSAMMGWKDSVPACGETGTFETCTGGLSCQITNEGVASQPCN